MSAHPASSARVAGLPALAALAAAPVPVVVAPMAGGPSTPELVAAVIGAGGAGMLAGGMKTPDAVRGEVAAARALLAPGAAEGSSGVPSATGRPDDGPLLRLGVNLFVPDAVNTQVPARDARTAAARRHEVAAFAERLRPVAARLGADVPSAEDATPDPAEERAQFEQFLAAAEEQAWPWVTFTFGLPAPEVFARLIDAGVAPGVTVTDVAEARAAVGNGARLLVVQGPDAGGHRGTLDPAAAPGTAPLDELIRAIHAAFPEVPVVAAGGIGSAAQARAALDAGAAAVQAGTAFLRSPEAGTSAAHRAGLARAAEPGSRLRDTAVTRAFTGRWARGLAVPFMEDFADAPAAYPEVNVLTGALRRAAAAAGDLDAVHLWAGTGAHRAREAPAAEVLRSLAP